VAVRAELKQTRHESSCAASFFPLPPLARLHVVGDGWMGRVVSDGWIEVKNRHHEATTTTTTTTTITLINTDYYHHFYRHSLERPHDLLIVRVRLMLLLLLRPPGLVPLARHTAHPAAVRCQPPHAGLVVEVHHRALPARRPAPPAAAGAGPLAQ
jgi:hypothetical protein